MKAPGRLNLNLSFSFMHPAINGLGIVKGCAILDSDLIIGGDPYTIVSDVELSNLSNAVFSDESVFVAYSKEIEGYLAVINKEGDQQTKSLFSTKNINKSLKTLNGYASASLDGRVMVKHW